VEVSFLYDLKITDWKCVTIETSGGYWPSAEMPLWPIAIHYGAEMKKGRVRWPRLAFLNR
jgi:hypothetical protein